MEYTSERYPHKYWNGFVKRKSYKLLSIIWFGERNACKNFNNKKLSTIRFLRKKKALSKLWLVVNSNSSDWPMGRSHSSWLSQTRKSPTIFRIGRRKKAASNLLPLWISDLLPCHWQIEKFDFLEIVIDAIFFPGPDLLNLKLVSMHFHITISTCSARAIFHPRCKWNPP